MNSRMAYQAYHKAQAHECMTPQQLTLILYKEAIKRLNLTKSALMAEDIAKRGENLGRAIAIISELNACLVTDSETEEILFLRGLYTSILTELPKLKDIWENDVMGRKIPERQPVAVKSLEYA